MMIDSFNQIISFHTVNESSQIAISAEDKLTELTQWKCLVVVQLKNDAVFYNTQFPLC
jgi:hypothetical protein